MATLTAADRQRTLESLKNKKVVNSRHVHAELIFRPSIDFGTSNIKVAWEVCGADYAKDSEIYDIKFDNNTYQTPAVVAYDENGQFLWGQDVVDRLESQQISESAIIKLSKLAIFQNDLTKNIRAEVERKLKSAGKTIDDLLTDLLTAINEYTRKQAINIDEVLRYGIATMRQEALLTLPQMWDEAATNTMMRAAFKAGIQKCDTVSEPEAAAVHAIEEQLQGLASHISINDIVLLLDAGGGTADFVAYGIKSDSARGAQTSLKTAHPSEGRLCGAQFINQEFLTWVRDTTGQTRLKEVLADLDLEEDVFFARASAQFEEEKIRFRNRKPKYEIYIGRGPNGRKNDHRIEWTLNDMRSFFQAVTNQIIAAVDDILRKCPAIRYILLPGGFGNSTFFRTKLEERYKPRGISILQPPDSKYPNPVARGALLRHRVKIENNFGSRSYGTLVSEYADEKLHPDTIMAQDPMSSTVSSRSGARPNKRVKASPKPTYKPNVVILDDATKSYQAVDRWCSLLKKGDKLEQMPFTTEKMWRRLFPDVPDNDEPLKCEFPIYFSPNVIEDHEPGRQNLPASNVDIGHDEYLREGISLFDVAIMEIPAEEARKLKTFRNEAEHEMYEFWICYALKINGEDVEFIFDIAPDGAVPYNKNMVQRKVAKEYKQWSPTWRQTIWRKSHNPIMRPIN